MFVDRDCHTFGSGSGLPMMAQSLVVQQVGVVVPSGYPVVGRAVLAHRYPV